MERRRYGEINKKKIGDTNGKKFVLCNYKKEDCNDSCQYGTCEWSRKSLLKLKEYEDLEEQGLLLKPKCKPGDIVWEANGERNIVSEYEVVSIRYGINKTFHYMWVRRSGIYSDLDGCRDKDCGKTVFLTQDEAEDVLKVDKK